MMQTSEMARRLTWDREIIQRHAREAGEAHALCVPPGEGIPSGLGRGVEVLIELIPLRIIDESCQAGQVVEDVCSLKTE